MPDFRSLRAVIDESIYHHLVSLIPESWTSITLTIERKVPDDQRLATVHRITGEGDPRQLVFPTDETLMELVDDLTVLLSQSGVEWRKAVYKVSGPEEDGGWDCTVEFKYLTPPPI